MDKHGQTAGMMYNYSTFLASVPGEYPDYSGSGLYKVAVDMDVRDFLAPQQNDSVYESYDTHFIPYPGQMKHVPTWELTIKVLCYVLVIGVALVGNVTVVLTVWRCKRLRTTTNFYIVNLAVSDLMVTLSCTWVHLVDDLTEGWVLGAFFCKFNTFVQVLSLASSIMTLTLISCDRFFGIVFAMRAYLTERRARYSILIIWMISIAISAPLLVYRQQFSREWADHVEIWCHDSWPYVSYVDPVANVTLVYSPYRKYYYTLVSLTLYFIPILIMSIAYVMIIYKLWSHISPGEIIDSEVARQIKFKKKVIVMLIVILLVFAVCWLPFQISLLFSEHRADQHMPLPHWYPPFQFFAFFLAYSNSALNPIIYTCFKDSFRRGFREAFSKRRKRFGNRSSFYYNTVELRSDYDRRVSDVTRL